MDDHEQDDDRERIKAYFIKERGYWRPWTEALLQASPAFLEHYAGYAGYPARTGPLSERMVELIYVALDTSGSHLFSSGLSVHMARALTVGATRADIFDVLHLVAAQGLSSVLQASAMLAEEAGEAHDVYVDAALRARITRVCPSQVDVLLMLAQRDAGYVDALLDFLEHGGPGDGLSPRERGIVEIALQSCFTAFHPDAVRRLMRVALANGTTSAEIRQAIQLGAHLSVHGTALGATVFTELAQ